MLVSASLLYRLLIQGRYLALRGTVLNAEQTMIRKHTTAFLVKCSTTTDGVDTLYICLPGLEEETDVS